MSADSFHARVETAMRQRKYLYDFDDFVRCVAKYGIATEMKEGDFIDFKSQLSVAKDTNYPCLSDVVEGQFRRG